MEKSLAYKIEQIKEALEKEEITRQEINCVAEYCVAKRILDGQGVKEKSVDRLLAKINKIRSRRKKESKNSVKTPLGVKKIEIEKVIEKEVSDSIISSKCDTEVVTDVSSIEQRLATLREENERLKEENIFLKGELERKDKENQELLRGFNQSYTVIDPSITVIGKQNVVIETIERHEQVIKEVLERIKDLEEQFAIEKSVTSKEKYPAYHGFSLSKLSSGYWQAVRRIDGSPQCVYVGRDVREAKEKIEKWLSKHYPDMLKEEHL